ncbi:MAG: tetratricopeptide repeat protein [Patescibacteria group bacterium]
MKNFSEFLVPSAKKRVSVSNDNFESSEKKLFFSWDSLVMIPLYLIVFLTPLFFLPWGVYLVSFNKQFLVLFLALLSLFGYLGKSLNEGKIVYRGGNLFLFLFFIFSFISLIFSDVINASIFGFNGSEADSFINLASFIVLFFLSSASITKENIKTLIYFLLGSSTVVLLGQIFQLFGFNFFIFDFTQVMNFSPIGSVFLSALFFSAQLVLMLSILITQKELCKAGKFFLVFLSALTFTYLFILGFKLIWLLLIFPLIFLLVFQLSSHGVESGSKKTSILVAGLSLIIFLYFTPFQPLARLINENKLAREMITPDIYLSSSDNLQIIKGTWFSNLTKLAEVDKATKKVTNPDGVKDFLVGVGGSNFVNEYLKWRSLDPRFIDSYLIKYNTGYSLVMTYLVGFGLLGGILFIIFVLQQFFLIAKNILQEKKDLAFSLLAFLFYFLVSIFLYNPGYVLLAISFIVFGALKAITSEEKEISLFSSPQRNFVLSLVIVVGMMLSIFGIYYNTARLIASFYYGSGVKTLYADTKSQLNAPGDSKIKKGVLAIENAIVWDQRNELYYRGLSELFLIKLGIAAEQEDTDGQKSIQGALLAIKQNPKNTLNYLVLVKIYETRLVALIGSNSQKSKEEEASLNDTYKSALGIYQEIAKLDPKNPEIPYMVARVHQAVSKSEEAKSSIKAALALSSNYSPAYFFLAEILQSEGKIKEAIEKTKNILYINPNDVGGRLQIGILYYQDKQFSNAKKEFEYITQKIPGQGNNARALYWLGLTQNELGEKNNALKNLEKVLSFNPGNKDIEKAINEVRGDESSKNKEGEDKLGKEKK